MTKKTPQRPPLDELRTDDVPELAIEVMRRAFPTWDDQRLREFARKMRPVVPGDLAEIVAHALRRDEKDSEQALMLAVDLLAWDQPLPLELRRWVIQVLMELAERGEIPPLRAGRRPNRRQREAVGVQVAWAFLALSQSTSPPAPIEMDAAIAAVLATMGPPFDIGDARVKQIRWGPDFEEYLRLAREAQAWAGRAEK